MGIYFKGSFFNTYRHLTSQSPLLFNPQTALCREYYFERQDVDYIQSTIKVFKERLQKYHIIYGEHGLRGKLFSAPDYRDEYICTKDDLLEVQRCWELINLGEEILNSIFGEEESCIIYAKVKGDTL